MARPEESEVLQQFRARVDGDDVDEVGLSFRIPAEVPDRPHAVEELRVEGAAARVHAQTDRPTGPPVEVEASVAAETTASVLQQVAEVADELVPRSEARFLPDSAVGSIRLEVGDRMVDLFFLVDEEDRQAQDVPLSARAVEVIEHLTELQHRVLGD
jgi:hypothetical protein